MSTSKSASDGLIRQGWLGIAFFMAVGLLLESLLAWKTPSYLADPIRRELFRLAHSHGALLHLLLIAMAFTEERWSVPAACRRALRVGSVLLPMGFLLAGLWHPEGDPGHAIWLVPAAALLVVFAATGTALASNSR